MAYYHECQKCGCSLDPNEKRICEECEKEIVDRLEEGRGFLVTSEQRNYFDNKK